MADRRSEDPRSRLTKQSTASMSASVFSSPANRSMNSVTAARIGQDQREHTGMTRGDPLLGGRQTGDLGDQDAPVGVVGTLQSEILTPVEQDIGGRISPEEIAQPAKFRGMLFVKEDRLQVQTVEQYQAAQAVGSFDRLGVPPEPVGHPRDQLTNRRPARSRISPSAWSSGPTRCRIVPQAAGCRQSGRHHGRTVTRADGLESQLDQHTQGGHEHGQGYGSLHG